MREPLPDQPDRESLQRAGDRAQARFRQGSPVVNASVDAPAHAPTSGPPTSAAATRNGPASETRVRRPTTKFELLGERRQRDEDERGRNAGL